MKLFHGSDHIIEQPRFGAGKAYNDYGRGFYCTEFEEAAKEWAVSKGRSGFANAYDLSETGLSVLNLNAGGYTTLHWLTVLLQNRSFDVDSTLAEEAKAYLTSRFRIDTESYDMIRGYRADDSYFSFAQDFLNGTISYRQLKAAMCLGRLGEQVMIRSRRAFSRLAFKGYESQTVKRITGSNSRET